MSWVSNLDWAHALAIVIVLVAALAGVVLTLLTLPGTWVAVATALLVKLWQPDLFPPWVVVTVIVLAMLGEAVELGASALGAAKGGASRRGALGAVVGSLVGAVIGSPFFFPIGTILGGVLGAAGGTVVMERGSQGRSWAESAKAGTGAAVGRLAATVAKTCLACLMALTLAVAVFFKAT